MSASIPSPSFAPILLLILLLHVQAGPSRTKQDKTDKARATCHAMNTLHVHSFKQTGGISAECRVQSALCCEKPHEDLFSYDG